ncbi:unnamed protein product [Microthlaspi erraticum]|uniref:CCHC-type domain-containing protein n=1 Tax=Microthlaspi erraticum TaxID=1685480 RepID=A0A6D2JHE3_9BRAS|nr:unnamed protein product [Microthlaspi erraticum]
MQESKSIDQNVDDFTKLIVDLGNLSIEIPEEVQAILLLNALPSRYDQLKETLKYSREGIKMEEIASAAKSKESEFRDMPSSRSNNGEGHYVRGREETRSFKPGKGKQQHKSRSKSRDGKRVCWICGKEGHFKKQCYKWLERNKGRGVSQEGEASLARDDAKDLVGLVAQEVNVMQGTQTSDEWIMDTGCSFHMTPRRDVFLEMKELNTGRVNMANNTQARVKGIGSVRFENPDGTTFVLHEVRFMPEIGRNLISMGTLEEKGCEFKGAGGVLKVIKGCTVIMRGHRNGNDTLYFLKGKARSSDACNASTGTSEGDKRDQTSL